MIRTTDGAVPRPFLHRHCHRLFRVVALVAASYAASFVLAPSADAQQATPKVVPQGTMTLAWHTGIAPRWLDPQEHDGTATPDNFLAAVHDALIKNVGTKR